MDDTLRIPYQEASNGQSFRVSAQEPVETMVRHARLAKSGAHIVVDVGERLKDVDHCPSGLFLSEAALIENPLQELATGEEREG